MYRNQSIRYMFEEMIGLNTRAGGGGRIKGYQQPYRCVLGSYVSFLILQYISSRHSCLRAVSALVLFLICLGMALLLLQ
jgi:hypothetical protein